MNETMVQPSLQDMQEKAGSTFRVCWKCSALTARTPPPVSSAGRREGASGTGVVHLKGAELPDERRMLRSGAAITGEDE